MWTTSIYPEESMGMGLEIERKYLISGEDWREGHEGTLYRQGYLNSAKERVVRARTMGQKAALTIKGVSRGATRLEFEYEIPLSDAEQLLELCEPPLIEKTRYVIAHGGLKWEVDEFHGANEGLIVAECELESEDQAIDKPHWIGEEVTGDPRYYNSNLIANPYTTWQDK
jgi:CYTH domain-containing protein